MDIILFYIVYLTTHIMCRYLDGFGEVLNFTWRTKNRICWNFQKAKNNFGQTSISNCVSIYVGGKGF